MATQFITNQETLLSNVVNDILPSSDKLHFLVGYFYFSGFQEIYRNLADKQVQILVGLEIETALANKIHEIEIIEQVHNSRGHVKEKYYKSLVTLFNDTDFFDSSKKEESFRLFLEKIKNGTLEIRKTLHPNHAKLYIFENSPEHNQNGVFPGTVITGSSNLTRTGLRSQFEINVLSRDTANFNEAMAIFQTLWRDAVAIVDKNNLDDFMQKVVEKIWLEKLPKPFLLYIRVLEEYFGIYKTDSLRLPSEISQGKYINLQYQVDAVEKAIDILQRHNGVIIADVVGLGKSIIASVIAHNLNIKTIIITPPHLKEQWEDYHYDFEFHAKIYTSGKIEDALEENSDGIEKLIIIDEAHKYRNELTADYASLHKLCQGNKVILLSATPFNNRPQDVFSMVRLFQLSTRSTLQTVDNLSFQFRQLVIEYKRIKEAQKTKAEPETVTSARVKAVAKQIRDILFPLVIRRSRLDLEAIEEYRTDLKKQKISFPKVNEPQILEYDLNDLSDLYEKTLEIISPEQESGRGFIGARYMPTNYIKDFEKYRERIALEMGVDENLLRQTQINLAQFMRRLLVRRFESSIYAFQQTLDSLIRQSELICDWYHRLGRIPIYKKGALPDVDALLESVDEDLDEELKQATLDEQLQEYKEKGLWWIEKKEVRKAFIDDVEKDIEILKDIRSKWFDKGMPHDPKLGHFADTIKKQLKKEPKRKIIVFTEFADTAQHLFDNLKDTLRVFKYSGRDASKQNKKTIKENFDAAHREPKNDYDVLIATDAISEGFNLHRAGTVFNYDIPYNPTRVIQRVGRINRINKKVFDELFIYNFFPTATGERETGVKRISTLKIAMVHALFGEDTKVLTKDEELRSFFADEYRKAATEQEELSPEAVHEDFIRRLRATQPEIVKAAMDLPKRCRIRRDVAKGRKGVAVFGKKGQEYAFRLGLSPSQSEALGVADALGLFEADITENAQQVSPAFDAIYEHLKGRLFARRTEIALDRGKQDAINKIEKLKELLPVSRDYLEDLLYVTKELDALPDRYARMMRAIDSRSVAKDFAEFIKEVPHGYLMALIERERSIEEGKETLIVSEELV